MVNVIALQMTSSPDVNANLDWVENTLAQQAVPKDALVVLPECFACFGTRDREMLAIAEQPGAGVIQQRLAQLARQFQCYLVAGTIPLKADETHFTASCLLFGPTGEVVAEYQKIHLFDVMVSDGTGQYLESKYTQAGSQVVSVETPIGHIGLAVCYDLRFPGLFDAMGDVDIIAVPAAFTKVTGQAHWQTLIGCRAIEKQCFVVAANQTGVHENARETYGHSQIVSPWGEQLATSTQDTGAVSCLIDLADRDKIKTSMPIIQHNRFRSYFV